MFIYSLPVFFGDIGILSPLELLLIVLTLTAILWISAPEPVVASARKVGNIFSIQQYLLEAWLGLKPLWTVFWPFFVLLNLILYYVDGLAKRGEFTVSSWDDVHFILFTPVLFWSVCVWRNSVNTELRIWSALARLMILAVFFEYILKLVIRNDYPRVFFNCQDILLDYAACF